MLYAVTHYTAAELITMRADADKPNMGLTTWKGNIVRKQDIVVAKNYLSEDELDSLNRLTTIFLETAELRVKERKDLNLDFWRQNVDALIAFQGKDVLIGNGTVSNQEMEILVKKVYTEFDVKRKHADALAADEEDLKLLDDLEKQVKNTKRP